MHEAKIKTLLVADNQIEAYFIKSLLESEGISVYLFDEFISQLIPCSPVCKHLGIRIAVKEEDFSRANDIVKEVKKRSPLWIVESFQEE